MKENLLNNVKKLIEQNYRVKEICQELRISQKQYRYYREKLGITMDKSLESLKSKVIKNSSEHYKEAKTKVKDLYKKLQNLDKVASELNVSRDFVRTHLKRQGVNIVNLQNIVNLDETVFEKIDSEEKAYWLGFLMADGNISNKNLSNRNRVEVTLAEKDKNHLEKLKSFLDYKGKISYREKQKAYRLAFNSVKMHQDLNNLGCTPVKSLTLEFPSEEKVPQEFIPHFIRGYFDGDGSILNPEKYPIGISILGTYSFLNTILQKLKIVKQVLRKDKRHISNTFSINLCGNNARSFVEFIYKDANVYLERKYKRYIAHIARFNRNVKTVEGKIGEVRLNKDNTELTS